MKIYFDTIGCRLNQSEIEKMAGQFRALGHQITSSSAEADLVVVNTCTVTHKAAADSRKIIRQAARKGAGQIVVTGCWSDLEPQSALALDKVSKVISNQEKDQLVRLALGIPSADFDIPAQKRIPIPGQHYRTRSFIKVQDGCDNHCTFCVTRIARGKSRSLPQDVILEDIELALAGGAQEIVLTGVNLGSWGRDFSQQDTLRALIQLILDETEVPRLRLSSIEPWDLTGEFFELWRDARMCPHLHVSAQSGSNEVLKRMGRKNTRESFMQMVQDARSVVPDIAFTTDIIVGFPGESAEDFEQSVSFVEKVGFAGGHVFNFSIRPGTPAEKFADQIAVEERKCRSAGLRELFNKQTLTFRQRFVGRQVSVLWERSEQTGDGKWLMKGLTGNYLPIQAEAGLDLWNQISQVKIEKLTEKGYWGCL